RHRTRLVVPTPDDPCLFSPARQLPPAQTAPCELPTILPKRLGSETVWPANAPDQSAPSSRASSTVLTRFSAGRTPQISSARSTPGVVARTRLKRQSFAS